MEFRGRKVLHRSLFGIIEEPIPEGPPINPKNNKRKKSGTSINNLKEEVEGKIEQVETSFGKVCPTLASLKSRKRPSYRKQGTTITNISRLLEKPKNIKSVTPGVEMKPKREELLASPSLKHLQALEDGEEELRRELQQSQLRLIAVKRGATFSELIPDHSVDHYLSNRINEQSSKLNKTASPPIKRKKAISPYTMLKPPAIILQPVKKYSKYRFQSSKYLQNSRNLSQNPRTFDEEEHKDPEFFQLSYITKQPVEPYIILKDINELYEALQEKNIKESPFFKGMRKKNFSFSEFIDFVWDKWIQENGGNSPKEKRRVPIKQRQTQMLPTINSRRTTEDRMSNSPKDKKRPKAETFGDFMKLYKEKSRLEKYKREVNIEQLREKGTDTMIEEIFHPSINEVNPVVQTREACREFYLRKQRIRENMLKKLDSVASERPFAAKLKKKSLIEGVNYVKGRQNLSEQIRVFRIMAEKERIKKYKEVLSNSATFYYKTIVGMILQKLQKTETLHFFADYMKSVIESGVPFGKDHLIFIIKEIQPEKMSTQEFNGSFLKKLCKEMGVSQQVINELFNTGGI